MLAEWCSLLETPPMMEAAFGFMYLPNDSYITFDLSVPVDGNPQRGQNTQPPLPVMVAA